MAKKRETRGRPVSKNMKKLKNLGLFSVADAIKHGISKTALFRYLEKGIIVRDGRSLFHYAALKLDPQDIEFAAACRRFGASSAIGGLTALAHYQLIEQVPKKIWIVVPYEKKSSDRLYRCLRTQTNPKMGIDEKGIYRITNIERTIVEAFRFATKIGLRTAMRALRTAIDQKQTSLEKVMSMARQLGLEKFLEEYWETIIPESRGGG